MRKWFLFVLAILAVIWQPVLAFASHVGDGGPV